jgi:hypothetical protein
MEEPSVVDCIRALQRSLERYNELSEQVKKSIRHLCYQQTGVMGKIVFSNITAFIGGKKDARS